jgi:hypothetical protein
MFLDKFTSTLQRLSRAQELLALTKEFSDYAMSSIFWGNEILAIFMSNLKLALHEATIFCYRLSFVLTISGNIFS